MLSHLVLTWRRAGLSQLLVYAKRDQAKEWQRLPGPRLRGVFQLRAPRGMQSLMHAHPLRQEDLCQGTCSSLNHVLPRPLNLSSPTLERLVLESGRGLPRVNEHLSASVTFLRAQRGPRD